jgi:hypothetical protein
MDATANNAFKSPHTTAPEMEFYLNIYCTNVFALDPTVGGDMPRLAVLSLDPYLEGFSCLGCDVPCIGLVCIRFGQPRAGNAMPLQPR